MAYVTNLLQKALNFNDEDVYEKFRQQACEKFGMRDESALREAREEAMKFLVLCATNGKNQSVPMCSVLVDEYWHTFILFTKMYMSFCDQIAGRYIHHDPLTSSDNASDGIDTFKKMYQDCFGTPLPEVWSLMRGPCDGAGCNASDPCRSCNSD